MPTYHEVMTTDLSKLTTAATKWDDMAGEFKKLEEQYERDVHGISLGQTWLGVSSNAANGRFTVTLNEYKAAQKEAKAIAALLRDAHTQFVDLRGKLQSVRDDAVKDGMKVSEQGYVSFDTSRLSDSERNAYVHDPSYQESARTAAGEWNQAITAAVKAVSDADDGVRIALEAVVIDSNLQDGTYNGFNAGAKDDIEEYEAENAKDIATRINGGEKVPAADLAELQRSFRDNSDNKAFSQTFLNGLGPSGTIQLGNKLNDKSHSGSGDQQKLFRSITSGLADTMAGATRPPVFKDSEGKALKYGTAGYQKAFDNWLKQDDGKFYTEWREGLKKAGVEKFDMDVVGDKISVGTGHGQEARGYQSLVTLMQQGSGYSPQFMADITDDMIAAEKKDPDVWDLHGKFEGKEDGWFANDPVDGALSIMSRDPDGATVYLDPGTDGKNDRLEYLLKERDWDTVNTTEWTGNIERTGDDTAETDARKGLGAALEAGATGQEPGTPLGKPEPHSESQARVMQSTIALLDKGAAGDTVHENLKVPLGRALNDYTADTHAILGGYAPNSPVGQDHIAGSGDSASITNSKESLLRVMRGVSDGVIGTNSEGDPVRVFDSLYEGQRLYAAEYLDTGRQVPQSSLTENVTSWDVRSRHVGEAFGGMNAIGTDMILDDRDTEVGKINDQARYAYHGYGALANTIPQVGDIAQRAVDAATYEWSKDVITEKENIARAEVSKETAGGIAGTNDLIDSWADTRDAKGSDAAENAKGEAKQSYITGREEAYSALRTRK